MRALKLAIFFSVFLSAPVLASAWLDVGSATYRFFFKTITTASLQVKPEQRADDWLAPTYAKRLQIRYGMAVSAERLAELFMKTLEAAYGVELLGNRHEAERFVGAFKAVEKGDYYRLQWEKGTLRLSLNGQPLYSLSDPDAARMLMSVWMGEEPISKKQRQALYSQWRAYQQQLAIEG